MAIFGNLNHMSLGDLLPLLSVQDGALEIFNLEQHPRVTLYFRGGLLQCLYVGGRPADALKARSTVSRLVSAKRGSFEFAPGAQARRCPQPLGWALDQLLLTTVTVQDEIEELERRLPHPETIFRRVRDADPEDARLSDFWRRAHDLLGVGASARELSVKLGMSLDHAQYYLLKLRQSGLVEPVRARVRRPGGRSAAARLLSSLKRHFFGGRQAWNH
jgi:DNA-binding transcriptional ArsR family regulator